MEKITKWCIRRTENYYEPINKWFCENTGSPFTANNDYHPKFGHIPSHYTYIHYPKVNEKYVHKKIMAEYTEITHNEFEKYILNVSKKVKLFKNWVNPNEKNEIFVIRK